MAVVFRASSLPGLAERLARVSSGNEPRSLKFICWEVPDVLDDRDAWEVFSQDSLGVWLDFAECDGFNSGPSCGEGESSDSGKEINVSWSVIPHNTSKYSLHSSSLTI